MENDNESEEFTNALTKYTGIDQEIAELTYLAKQYIINLILAASKMEHIPPQNKGAFLYSIQQGGINYVNTIALFGTISSKITEAKQTSKEPTQKDLDKITEEWKNL